MLFTYWFGFATGGLSMLVAIAAAVLMFGGWSRPDRMDGE